MRVAHRVFRAAVGCAILLTASPPTVAGTAANDDDVIPRLKLGDVVLTNAVAVEENPVDILFRGDGAVYKRVKRQNLPATIKDKYPYDADAATKYEKDKADQKKAFRESMRNATHSDLLRQEKVIETQIKQATTELERINRDIRNWRHRPRGSGKKPVINQLMETKRKQMEHIDNLRTQLDATRSLLDQFR